jgi:hypothetical protein
MALRDLVVARKSVSVMGTDLSVRGLSFHDLSRLVVDHRADFVAVMEQIQGSDAAEMGGLVQSIASTAPALVAKVIALACDEPDLAEAAASIPMPVQLELVLAIGELTFTEPGALPKFLASLTGLLAKGADLVPQAKTL